MKNKCHSTKDPICSAASVYCNSLAQVRLKLMPDKQYLARNDVFATVNYALVACKRGAATHARMPHYVCIW